MCTAAELRRLGFRKTDCGFLRQVVEGGRSNTRGGRYEDLYATFQLLVALAGLLAKPSGGEVSVELQANAYVNDVLVRFADGSRDYFQLKTSPQITWGRSTGKLRRQFELQRKLCVRRRQNHALFLVSPHRARLKHLDVRRPNYAQVIIFPNAALSSQASPARSAIQSICASPAPRRSDLTAIGGACRQIITDASKPVSARQVLRVLQQQLAATVRKDQAKPPTDWPTAKSRLESALPGLSLSILRGVCTFSFGMTRGRHSSHCDSIQFTHFVWRVMNTAPLPRTIEEFGYWFI